MNEMIKTALSDAQNLLQAFMEDEAALREIENIARQLVDVYSRKGKLIVFGNGGSMCDAMHMAEELTGRYHDDRPALAALAISDAGHISCVANDYGYDSVFSRGVEALANAGDMVIGISTSGNSANVLKAMQAARDKECFTAVLLGKDGGKLLDSCDFQILVPAFDTARIQEIHGIVIHILISLVEKELFFTPKASAIPCSQIC